MPSPTKESVQLPQNRNPQNLASKYFPEDPLSSKHILNLIIISTVAVVAFGIGFYSLYFHKPAPHLQNPESEEISPTSFPTGDPTGSWSTYTNKKYDYKIQYPQNFKPSFGLDPSYVHIEGQASDNGGHIDIIIDAGNIKKVSFPVENWVRNNFRNQTIQDVEIADTAALSVSLPHQSEFGSVQNYFFSRNNRVYFLSSNNLSNPPEVTLTNVEELSWQILSTFTFLDFKNSTPSPKLRISP